MSTGMRNIPDMSVTSIRAAAGKIRAQPVEFILLLLAPLLWMAPAWTSLWLDEGITYWLIKDGPAEAVRRTLEYQGQSPLYFIVAWMAMAVGGHSEFVLRLPSLIATALATWVVYRLGRRILDERTAVIAATLFAYWVYLASNMPYNARPYALAVFAVAASTLALIRWLESSRRRDALVYVGFATLLLYTQPLYAGMFAVHLVIVLEFRRLRTTSVTLPKFGCVLAVALALALPLTPQVLHFSRLLGSVFRSSPPVSSLYVSLSVLWPVAVIVLVWCVRRRFSTRPPLFLYLWCLVPPLWLLVAMFISGDVGPVGRFTYWQFPGVVLLLATAIAAINPRLRAGLLIVVALAAFTENRRALEDWRQATALTRPLIGEADTPILVRTGLPLARLTEWLETPEHAEHVLAPLAYYPLAGVVRALPYDLDADYLGRVVIPAVSAHHRILILAHDYNFEQRRRLAFQTWFDEHLPRHRSTLVARIDNLVILVYDII